MNPVFPGNGECRVGPADAEVFLRGICLVQLEPMWGGQEDVAAELRC